jgi:DNA-binding CsgD family transcriptional regulator
MDSAVLDRIVADSRGNPLALLELPSGLTHAELAGGFGLPSSAPLTTLLEEGFMNRVMTLPPQTRTLLLLAAMDATGAPELVRRAATALGVDPRAAEAAELAGLVEFEPTVSFQHPLVRSAVIRLANGREAQRAHGALAASTNPDLDPDRRAWHRALAADGPDESVARELEVSAGRAQVRGGFAAAAAFLEAAAGLTPDPVLRGTRSLRAAEAKYQAGSVEDALELLAGADVLPRGEREIARADLLRGQLALFSRRGRDAARLLLEVAHRWEALDPRVAREAYLDAVSAGIGVGRFAEDVNLHAIATAAKGVPAEPGHPLESLLNGFATLVTDGYEKGTPLLQEAVKAFKDGPVPVADSIRWSWLATRAARDVWDDENGDLLSARHVALARESGALSALPTALTTRLGMHLYRGEIDAAAILAEEIDDVAKAAGLTTPAYGALALAALQGKENEFTALASTALENAASRGDGLGFVIVQFSGAVLYNSLGDYRKALDFAQAGSAYPDDLCYSVWSLTELIEAASRTGQRSLAEAALVRLAKSTRASGTEWSLGVEARSRALARDDDSAESAYVEAIERLEKTRIRMELARAHLVFGEWLRRRGRRVDARENLRIAYELFSNAGAEAFAERARRELSATGEIVRKRVIDSKDKLTAQEAQIAMMAAAGRSNPEIGAELFISARTVEWHLGKVYPKLGISSRRELAQALADREQDVNTAPNSGRGTQPHG